MEEYELVERPWGNYKTIFMGDTYQVKRIVVYPNSKLSLQSHNHRSEHWIMVEGNGNVTLGNSQIELKKDEHVYIPVQEKHRMSNFTDKNVVFIEVQNGDYLGEDDIVRYEDMYGRK
jgi:mannose-6-phosphate isomerase-like protein (cupin superfamily)